MLPTDERFLALYDEQKIALFEGLNQLPNNEFLKKVHLLLAEKNRIKEKPAIEFIEKGVRARMVETMRKQGLTQTQIEQDLQSMGEQKKKLELKSIEERLSTAS